MKKFAEMVLRFRIQIIVITSLLTIFFAYQLKDVKVNSDILTYLKPDDPAVVLFNRVGEEYAGTALTMVGIESKNIFDYKTLETINKLTEKIKSIDGVATVMSLTDILDIKSVNGGLEIGKLINKNNIPTDKAKLQKVRKYTLSKKMYNGRIVSADGKITLIIARLKQSADKEALAKEIQTISKETASEYKLYFSGLPMQMLEITKIIKTDIVRLVPIVVLVLIAVLYFSFRTKRGVILPLIAVLISVIWAMGLMTLLGIDQSIISNGMPVLLIAICSASGIHMISRYNEDILTCKNRKKCIQNALAEVGIPILLAGITTMVGFFAFVGSYLTIVTQFGIFTGIGVAFGLLVSITFIPAVLSYLKQPKIKQKVVGKDNNLLSHFLDKWAYFVLNKSKWIIASSVIIIILAAIGIPSLHREVNMTEYFKKNTDIRLAEEMMEKNFGGSTPIQVVIKGDLKNPFVLKEMKKLEGFMVSIPNVNHPQSVADLICEMNKVMNGHYTIPDTREGVSNLWFFIQGESVMKQLVNKDNSEGLVQGTLGTVKTQEIQPVVDAINYYVSTRLDKKLIAVKNVNTKKPKIQKYLTEEILIAIDQDAKSYLLNIELNKNELKKQIIAINNNDKIKYNKENLDKISSLIDDFFLNESEIIINSKQVISSITRDIIKELEITALPSTENISKILNKNRSSISHDDQEYLHETVQSLWIMLNDYYEHEKIKIGVEDILPQFPEELKSNSKFKTDLYNDLWALNETNVALPKSLVNEYNLSGKNINISAEQTGMPLIFTRLDKSLIESQIQSLIIAFVLVTLILIVQLKSITGGFIAVSPIALTVILNFAMMAYLKIPLDMATILIASIALGIGIDYSIHFTSRFKEEFVKSNSQFEALEKTLTTTGRAILINALTVALGFSVLMMGQLVPMQRFGWLTATSMIISAFGAITFLPALILVTKTRFVGDFSRFDSLNKLNGAKNRIKSIIKNNIKK